MASRETAPQRGVANVTAERGRPGQALLARLGMRCPTQSCFKRLRLSPTTHLRKRYGMPPLLRRQRKDQTETGLKACRLRRRRRLSPIVATRRRIRWLHQLDWLHQHALRQQRAPALSTSRRKKICSEHVLGISEPERSSPVPRHTATRYDKSVIGTVGTYYVASVAASEAYKP